jgi:hypothetical protein
LRVAIRGAGARSVVRPPRVVAWSPRGGRWGSLAGHAGSSGFFAAGLGGLRIGTRPRGGGFARSIRGGLVGLSCITAEEEEAGEAEDEGDAGLRHGAPERAGLGVHSWDAPPRAAASWLIGGLVMVASWVHGPRAPGPEPANLGHRSAMGRSWVIARPAAHDGVTMSFRRCPPSPRARRRLLPRPIRHVRLLRRRGPCPWRLRDGRAFRPRLLRRPRPRAPPPPRVQPSAPRRSR